MTESREDLIARLEAELPATFPSRPTAYFGRVARQALVLARELIAENAALVQERDNWCEDASITVAWRAYLTEAKEDKS